MIEFDAPLKLEAHREHGWELMFQSGGGFDYNTPFRGMLTEIAIIRGQDPDQAIRLPVYEAFEDFVEGSLQFDTVPIRIYYEHTLSYLVLTSSDEIIMREVFKRVHPYIVVVAE